MVLFQFGTKKYHSTNWHGKKEGESPKLTKKKYLSTLVLTIKEVGSP